MDINEALCDLNDTVERLYKAQTHLQEEVSTLKAQLQAQRQTETLKMFYETRLQLLGMRGESETEAKALHDLTDAIQELREALTDEQEPASQPDTGDNPDGQESQGGEGVEPEAQPEEPEQPEVYP
jgi:chaperonin cofactor prefoldin